MAGDAVAVNLAGACPCRGDRLGLPVAVIMAGGQAGQVQDIVDSHRRTTGLAAEVAANY